MQKNNVMVMGLVVAGAGAAMMMFLKSGGSKPAAGGPQKPAAGAVAPAQPVAPAANAVSVFIKIPEAIEPTQRAQKYEIPIGTALKKAGAGAVTNAGAGMKEGTIVFVGVTVGLTDLKKGLAILKAELTRIGAPKETRLQFKQYGQDIDVEFGNVE